MIESKVQDRVRLLTLVCRIDFAVSTTAAGRCVVCALEREAGAILVLQDCETMNPVEQHCPTGPVATYRAPSCVVQLWQHQSSISARTVSQSQLVTVVSGSELEGRGGAAHRQQGV